MGIITQKDRGFNNLDIISLLPINDIVGKINGERIKKLGMPIALIKSKNTGKGSKFSAVIKVMLNGNKQVSAGLSNGSTRVIKDILYNNCSKIYNFLKCIAVDFKTQHKGSAMFERDERVKQYLIFPATNFIQD